MNRFLGWGGWAWAVDFVGAGLNGLDEWIDESNPVRAVRCVRCVRKDGRLIWAGVGFEGVVAEVRAGPPIMPRLCSSSTSIGYLNRGAIEPAVWSVRPVAMLEVIWLLDRRLSPMTKRLPISGKDNGSAILHPTPPKKKVCASVRRRCAATWSAPQSEASPSSGASSRLSAPPPTPPPHSRPQLYARESGGGAGSQARGRLFLPVGASI